VWDSNGLTVHWVTLTSNPAAPVTINNHPITCHLNLNPTLRSINPSCYSVGLQQRTTHLLYPNTSIPNLQWLTWTITGVSNSSTTSTTTMTPTTNLCNHIGYMCNTTSYSHIIFASLFQPGPQFCHHGLTSKMTQKLCQCPQKLIRRTNKTTVEGDLKTRWWLSSVWRQSWHWCAGVCVVLCPDISGLVQGRVSAMVHVVK
jgi:hypothetical protein